MNCRISDLKFRLATVIGTTCALSSTALAGARIDLRPTQPIPAEGFQPGQIVNVEVYMVDTGNPQVNIRFRGIALDFTDSAVELMYHGPDQIMGTLDDNEFQWVNPFGLGVVLPDLPLTLWAFPLPVWPIPPGFVIELPDGGEVRLGDLSILLPDVSGSYVLNALNADEQNSNLGASASFGHGQPNDDPPTTWRAYTGELTGGVLELPVIPEPASLILLAATGMALLRCRAISQ